MKILIATGLYPPQSGGPATYSKLLNDELPKRGIEVKVLPFREVQHLPNVIRQIAYFFKVISRSRGCDVIYAQDTISVGWPAFFASLFVWKKFIVRVPGDHIWEQGRQRFGITSELDEMKRFSLGWNPYLLFLRFLQYFVTRFANAVVVPSNYMQKVVMSWGVPKQKIHVIYSSVELPVPTQEPRDRPQGFLITTIARLVPWKGVDGLISVVASEPNWTLVIVDDGPERTKLEALARELKVYDRVKFVGRLSRPEALGWAKVSDVFVLNSTYEGLSHVLIEVMSLGVPVLATTSGGNPELVGDENLFVKSGNNQALRDQLKRIENDPDAAHRRGQFAATRAQDFSIDKTLVGLVVLLKSL
jgi:glycosyltransferase involved in cell wall biosynthesis